MIDNSGDRTGS